MNGNYTLSHCIGDNADTDGMGPNAGQSIQKIDDRRFDRGNCSSDRRHIFNMTAVAGVPTFGKSEVEQALLSNWRLSGIYRVASGSYLTVTSGVDRSLTGIPNQRPDQILADREFSPHAAETTRFRRGMATICKFGAFF